MEDNSKKNNPVDPEKLRDADRTSDSNLKNPGLKDEKVTSGKGKDSENDLFNEDPLEEKRAIEETSEDRLNSAD